MPKDNLNPKDKTLGQEINGIVLGVGGKFIKYGFNIIMVVVNLGAIVLMTVVSIGFQGWNYLWTPTFIVTTIILFVIYISTHWSFHNLRLKKLRENERNIKYFNEQEEDINKITRTTEWLNNCGEFLAWRDVEMKKDAWRIYMQNSLIALDKKYRKKRFHKQIAIDRRIITEYERKHLTAEEIDTLQNEIDKAKENNHYTQLKLKYQEQLTDEWIVRNLDKFNIDHDEVDRLFVEHGTMSKRQRKSKSQASYTKDNWSSRVIALLMSGFITMFSVDLALSWSTLEAWIIFAIRFLNLIINIIMGSDYGTQFFKSYDIHNVTSRKTITNEFKAWGLKKGIYTIAATPQKEN